MNGLPDRTNSVARVRSVQRPVEGAESTPRSDPAAVPPQDALTLVRVSPLKLLRLPAVLERTGLSRSTIWRLERVGAFPRHLRISPNAVGWLEDDIAAWILARPDALAG